MESNWELNHVGLITWDWYKVLDYYEYLGIGLSVGPQPLLSFDYVEVHGKPLPIQKRHRFDAGSVDRCCQIGSLQLELLEPRTSRDSNLPFLESKGEGISHICYQVPDPKGETSKLLEKGVPLIFSGDPHGFIIENYLDTSKVGNIWLSLRPPAGKWGKAWVARNMSHYMVSNWKFRGVGVGVRDLDKAVEYYQSLGIATFQPEVMDTIVKARTRIAQIGPVAHEFVQPLEGETIYNESLDTRGEGINDIAFTVDDLDKEIGKLTAKGVHVTLSGKLQTGSAFAYFDTRRFGNMMVKLVQAE